MNSIRSFLSVLFVLALMVALIGCSKNSAELSEQVRREMQAEFSKKPGLKGLVMESVKLIQKEKDGFEYEGVGKGNLNGNPVEFDVRCKYDGSTVMWTADLTSDCIAYLSAKEKTNEAIRQWKAAWPDIKDGLRRKYEAACTAAAEACEKAAKQVDAICDEAAKAAAGAGAK